ncbi:hypothetical protein [Kitasatospora sp. NPDC088351]|uniref:hypothetical protein n=1 Tax=Kitasatospora sp. NPDC088351 TaxID=3155180 RepID=UPI003415CE4F
MDLTASNYRGAMSRACERVKSCNEATLLTSSTAQLVALGEITGSDRGGMGGGRGPKGAKPGPKANTGRSDNGAKTGQGRSTNPSTPQSEKSVAARQRAECGDNHSGWCVPGEAHDMVPDSLGARKAK